MRFGTVSGISVGLALALGATGAGAASCGEDVPCACGDTLRGRSVLTADLVDCPDDGLRLVDDSELDCDGHRITGRGKGEGILLDEAQGATVTNCRVVGFHTGIRVRGGKANRVLGSEFVDSERYGIELARAPERTLVQANLVSHSGDEGIHVGTGAHGSVIVANEIESSEAENLYVLSSDGGMIAGNLLAGSGKAALYVKHSSDVVVGANEIRGHIVHVRGASMRNVFLDNQVEGGRFVFEAYKDPEHPAAVNGWTRPAGNLVEGGAVLDTETCFQFKGASDNRAEGVASDGCTAMRESKKGGMAAKGNEVALVEAVH